MELLNRDKRDGYIYDPIIKGVDSNYWSQIAGTITVASNKLRFNAATGASFLLHEFVDQLDFIVNVPVKPTSGDSRRFGLYSPAGSSQQGAIYFDITDTAFTVVVIDSFGQSQTLTLTWDDTNWTAKDILFRIKWEPDIVQFWVDGSILGTFSTTSSASIPFVGLPIYIKNGNADNMDITYVAVRRAAGIV